MLVVLSSALFKAWKGLGSSTIIAPSRRTSQEYFIYISRTFFFGPPHHHSDDRAVASEEQLGVWLIKVAENRAESFQFHLFFSAFLAQ